MTSTPGRAVQRLRMQISRASKGYRRKTFRCTLAAEIDNGQGLDTNAEALRQRKQPHADRFYSCRC
jgi:hypothetical protein